MANTNFLGPENYSAKSYKMLPFRFDRWSDNRIIVTNDVSEHLFLSESIFNRFIRGELTENTPEYHDLKAKHFLYDDYSSTLPDMIAAKYRTKKSFLDGFTRLHIFVTSLRCNLSCQYCQVSRKNINDDSSIYDMSPEVLGKSIDLMLRSPSKDVTMEFQGGEPLSSLKFAFEAALPQALGCGKENIRFQSSIYLSNFNLLKKAVLEAKEKNIQIGKNIEFVICTNLNLLEDHHLDFFKEHDIHISTSLDGPAFIHDANRPALNREKSHKIVTQNIRRCQEALGAHKVSALMTTTRRSLEHSKAIIDEYVRMDLGSMFIRELNPYGFAVKSDKSIGYSTEEFLKFYCESLDYILQLSKEGINISEAYAGLVLSKMLTPWPIGFVDLQSPCGSGFGVTLYNYDGGVYASDESRMLAESGDETFRLGSVPEDSYEDIYFGENMQMLASAACNESLAGCSDCAYQAYCGADPVRNYATQKDIFGNRANQNGFCIKNKAIIKHLLELYDQADEETQRILWAWVNRDDPKRYNLDGFIS